MVEARRWPAHALSRDPAEPLEGEVCATMWPTRALPGGERWFDELYVWTEGFNATTTQRARIQSTALAYALNLLERERVDYIGLTLSFGTAERSLDEVAESFLAHPMVAHRVTVIMRGAIDRLRSRYRVRALVEHLRSQNVTVGLRVTAPRLSMELHAFELLQPEFAKLLAPTSRRPEYWQDLVLEARVAGVPPERLIVAGLETGPQLELARGCGIRFGQGSAVRASYAPPDFITARA